MKKMAGTIAVYPQRVVVESDINFAKKSALNSITRRNETNVGGSRPKGTNFAT